MRKILKSSLVILLISLMAIPVLSQEMTKEEKRAHKKEARKLLKESIKLMEENKLDDAILLLDSLIMCIYCSRYIFYFELYNTRKF